MADKWAHEVVRTLHKLGFGVRADPTTRFATAGENGRADQMIVRGGRGCYIEAKTGTTGFDFDTLRPNQREWIESFALPEPYRMEVWIWLAMGTDRPNNTQPDALPRKHWLIPYPVMLHVEKQVRPIQRTLPYRAGKGMRKEIQEQKLDALNLLRLWELEWVGGGVWDIPEGHLFHTIHLGDPLPLYGGIVQWTT
jgi:hypothetical protein